jgi:DNA-binding NtrC family response regulator
MKSARILVVEDERLLRWALKERLEQAGYLVLEAGTGKEALRQFGKGVDVVLLDIKLPDANGFDLLQRIKQVCPHCEVIVMTSLDAREAQERADREGTFRFVEKPFELDEMVGIVETALHLEGGF